MSISLRTHKRRACAGMARRFAMFGPPGSIRAIAWGFITAEDWKKILVDSQDWPGQLAGIRWRRWSQHAYPRDL